MSFFDHFGLIAPFYDRVFPTGSPKEWLSLLKLSEHSRILDVGGGTGRAANALQSCTELACVADVSFKMLSQANSKPGLTVACAASEYLPFPESSFDGIIMVDALHHVADQSQTVHELIRTLRVGGVLLIEEPDIQTFYIKIVALLEKLALMRSHFLNGRQIQSLFEQLPVAVEIVHSKFIVWVVVTRLH